MFNIIRAHSPFCKILTHERFFYTIVFFNNSYAFTVFPAGILQPVFYSKDFPSSMNFGGIGVVIGHEITHGFDDRGRLYDNLGNIRQWWDNVTIAKFEK
ncbi:hypothetical protein COOONC_19705, partial [Cooperia oncophora]